MKKTEHIRIRIDEVTKKKLVEKAKKARRTISDTARILIDDGIKKELKK